MRPKAYEYTRVYDPSSHPRGAVFTANKSKTTVNNIVFVLTLYTYVCADYVGTYVYIVCFVRTF